MKQNLYHVSCLEGDQQDSSHDFKSERTIYIDPEIERVSQL